MPTVTVPNQSTIVGRDATVMSVANIPGGNGSTGTPVSFLGSFKKASLKLKRKFVDVTGANDTAYSERSTMFDKGELTLSGFNRTGASSYAAIFAAGAFVQVTFTNQLYGDTYVCECSVPEFGTDTGAEATEDSLTLNVLSAAFGPGTPGTSAGVPAALTLD